MKENYQTALNNVLRSEGGFVNNPKDPGGMTNLGVTKRTYEQYVGHPVDEETMRGLTPETVAPLYKQMFWDAVRGDDLPDGLDADASDLVNKVCNERLVFLQSLNTWATFGKGWGNRVAYVQRTSLKMIA